MNSLNIKRLAALSLALVLFAGLLFGCSASFRSGGSGASAPQEAPPPMAPAPGGSPESPSKGTDGNAAEYDRAPPTLGGDPATGIAADAASRKIIRNAALSIETLDFDKSVAALSEAVAAHGGYIQNSTVSGATARERYGRRTAQYTLRIPSEKLDAFLSKSGTIGNVLETSTNEEEVTDRYFDIEARLKTLDVQRERLLGILEKAEDLTDVIELERALADVLYEIESLTGTLRKYDGLIAYSTVQLYLTEVYETTSVNQMPKTLGERIAIEWEQSLKYLRMELENFVVWLVGNSIVLLLDLILILIAALAALKIWRKAKKRRGPAAAAPPAAPAASDPAPAPASLPAAPEEEEKKDS